MSQTTTASGMAVVKDSEVKTNNNTDTTVFGAGSRQGSTSSKNFQNNRIEQQNSHDRDDEVQRANSVGQAQAPDLSSRLRRDQKSKKNSHTQKQINVKKRKSRQFCCC